MKIHEIRTDDWLTSKLFIHTKIIKKVNKTDLCTKLYTLSTGNYVNQLKNQNKNQNKSFVNKF